MTDEHLALDILNHCMAGRTHQIARIISARFDRALAEHGLTSHQLTLLSMVCLMQPVSARDMLPYLKMDQSTLSRNLDRMVASDWLASARDEGDQRTRRLRLTKSGAKTLRRAHHSWQGAQQWVVETLGDEGLRHMQQMAHRLNPMLPDANGAETIERAPQ